MRSLLILVPVLLIAGCSASGGSDPFAYVHKPLYVGGFDLAKMKGGNETQQFGVTDGSIGAIHAQVWINATAGGASVTIRDPGDRVLLTTAQTVDRSFGLDLGTWHVDVQGEPASAGLVQILVTRG